MHEEMRRYHRDRAIHHIQQLVGAVADQELRDISDSLGRMLNAARAISRPNLRILKGDNDE